MGRLEKFVFQPDTVPLPTAWARDWRKRWFREIGTVAEYCGTGRLWAYYDATYRPARATELIAEMLARPNGSGEVLAACRENLDRWHDRLRKIA